MAWSHELLYLDMFKKTVEKIGRWAERKKDLIGNKKFDKILQQPKEITNNSTDKMIRPFLGLRLGITVTKNKYILCFCLYQT